MSIWQTPAIVIAFLTWLLAPPSGLADVSRREALRRQFTPASARSLTNQAAARAALERDQLLLDALQSRINTLTADASARDDPAQRAQLYDQRTRVLTE